MKNFGRTSISEFLEDFVVYRNLVPMDNRLPSLSEIRKQVGLPPGKIPRKNEAEYARVIAHILQQARSLELPGVPLKRLIFIGDTLLNDSTAFDNLCQAGEMPGVAFIGSETSSPPAFEIKSSESNQLIFLANRWSMLADFEQFLDENSFPVDQNTAVIVDLDKTAIGARGRNAHVIDEARVQAVRETVAGVLGSGFNEAEFRKAYDQFNQVEFHPFTRDNQDYLAYICLILGSGLYQLERLLSDIRTKRTRTFEQFIANVEAQKKKLPPGLVEIHTDILANVEISDPTPFKVFRRNEYLTTVARMGQSGEHAEIKALLDNEILITQEVRALALRWKQRGALLFGLSDKPDEASIPTEELANRGYLPIHQVETHAVGQDL